MIGVPSFHRKELLFPRSSSLIPGSSAWLPKDDISAFNGFPFQRLFRQGERNRRGFSAHLLPRPSDSQATLMRDGISNAVSANMSAGRPGD